MIELIASLLVDLSAQKLTVLNSNQEVVLDIAVSIGKASPPTPIGKSKVFTMYRTTNIQVRTYNLCGAHCTMGVTAKEAICLHAARCQERTGQAFGVPRSHSCDRMQTDDAQSLFKNTHRGTPVTIQA